MNSLEAAMRVLRLADQSRPVLRVGEVSRELGLQKSTVSRLLRTMSEHELIERERSGQGYVAGRRALVLADLYLSAHTLLDLVDSAVNALVGEFEFVGYVAALSGADIVVLRVKHGRYPLRLVQEVGKRIPATSTALGLALLARKSDAEALELVRAGTDAHAEPSLLARRLDEIRSEGTASISSAIIPGIAAIGAAVGEPGGNEALGFALSYPVSAADDKLTARMAVRVREEGLRIGTRLGDPAWTALDPGARIIEMRSLQPSRQRRAPRARKAAG
jgi:DNA-binding IclR family transcriptional regulator